MVYAAFFKEKPVTQSNQRQNFPQSGTDVRERLIQAGTALFARKGYAATSVREIVARAGITKPVLYYHFNNKEGLFRAIMDGAACMQDKIITESMDTEGPTLSRITCLFQRFSRGVAEHRDITRMIHNLLFGPPQGAPKYDLDRFHRALVEAVESIYKKGLIVGDVRDVEPSEAAYLILGTLDFCVHLDLLHPEAHDPERPGRLLELAFRGLAADAATQGL
jgi:TetR/AcrR family transcriptional regulator